MRSSSLDAALSRPLRGLSDGGDSDPEKAMTAMKTGHWSAVPVWVGVLGLMACDPKSDGDADVDIELGESDEGSGTTGATDGTDAADGLTEREDGFVLGPGAAESRRDATIAHGAAAEPAAQRHAL